jgi:CRP-like cAMP-binding protein
MEFIRQYLLSKNIPLTEENWKPLWKKMSEKNTRKKILFSKKEKLTITFLFVETGAARLFNKENKELTIRFVFQHQFLTAYDSFTQRTPSRCDIEALTDMVVWQIHYDDLQEIYRSQAVGNLVGRLTVETLYVEKLNREFSFLSDTAEERYLKLMKDQPDLFQKSH